ncbi:glycosyltransferase family 2 protein [Haloplanus salinus]|uniref:Glycosyltransferase family 2 protein n=1 Tax=Haloplanus salinus TaxID=1126245 RepID=A0A368NEI6_9EURY|nr:glycosyltransferase family 2 protein [Haloplanus salinus]RCU48004.1 glycosyltransferase family 2 protein [Haloplanus salinus]
MAPPLVSVIVPTYNRATLVSRAIESVLHQTYANFELVVVDDASTDDTETVVRGYDDERVTYLCHGTNRRVSAARNTGIEYASGDYLAFLDDDDEWLPTKLERQIRHIEAANRTVGMVYCWMEYHDGETPVRQYRPQLEGDIFEETVGGQPIGACSTLVVRDDVVDEVGGFDESLPRGNDGDFIRRVARESRVEYVPEVLVRHYVDHEYERITDETSESIANAIKANEAKLKKFATELDEKPALKGEIYARLGLRHCQLGHYLTGMRYHLKAVRQDPLNPEIYKQQAVTLHRLLTRRP